MSDSLGKTGLDVTMDNPQGEGLTPEFVAGLIVGEGWFGLQVTKRSAITMRHGFTIMPRFCLQMNDRETMQSVISSWKFWGLPAWIVDGKNNSLRLEGAGHKRLKKIAEFFLPYLTGKKRRAAECVLEYITLRQGKSHQAPYDKEEFALVNKLRFEINDGRLKRRLIPSETKCVLSEVVSSDKDIVQSAA